MAIPWAPTGFFSGVGKLGVSGDESPPAEAKG